MNPGQWQELTKETLLLGPLPQAAYDQGRVLTELMQQQNREVVKLQETADRPAGRAHSRRSTARGGLRSREGAEKTSRPHVVSKPPPPPRRPQHPCAAISPNHPRPRYRRASVRGLGSVTKAGTDRVPRGIPGSQGPTILATWCPTAPEVPVKRCLKMEGCPHNEPCCKSSTPHHQFLSPVPIPLYSPPLQTSPLRLLELPF